MMVSGVSWAVLTVVVVSLASAGVSSADTDCCGRGANEGAECCPRPPISMDADNWSKPQSRKTQIVYDPDRCCGDAEEEKCGAFGARGCVACQDVCDEDDSDCVQCPKSNGPHARGSYPEGRPSDQDGQSVPYDPHEDDIWGYFNDDRDEDDWEMNMSPAQSYDFGDDPEDYDCSSCAWDNMSMLEQRLLTQRSRSLVCDASCLRGRGDPTYGVSLCNYFNEKKECRACCHEGHMVEGCMPCDGKGSCDNCVKKTQDVCKIDPCGSDCEAYICCSTTWADTSGPHSTCAEKMRMRMAELVDDISDKCKKFFMCDTVDVDCSDNARTCSASWTTGLHTQKEAFDTCETLSISGAASFDRQYASVGAFNKEVVFRAVGAKHKSYILQSVTFDACSDDAILPSMDSKNTDLLVAHSSSGFLGWDDDTEPDSHALNGTAGCRRHVWLLYDNLGQSRTSYVTVDASVYPTYITADWVAVELGGDMMRSDITISCDAEQSKRKEKVSF